MTSLHPRLTERAYQALREDRRSDAEEIHEALALRCPDLVITVAEANGLWSIYSDESAAGWLFFDPEETGQFADWILRRNDDSRAEELEASGEIYA